MKLALLGSCASIALLGFCAPSPAPQGAPSAAAKPAENYLTHLAKQKPIAGLAGFSSSSTLIFDAEPDQPHELTTTYVFPDRVRWYFALRGGEPGQRIIEYRCGDTFFTLDENSGRSDVVAPPPDDNGEWPAKCWAMELRRALFLWPDGFEWSGEGASRSAPSQCGQTISVRLGEDGKPSAIFLAGEENVHETYGNIRWRERNGRAWPASMDLTIEHSKVWSETIDVLETAVHLLDEFFIPPDRRALLDPQGPHLGGVRSSDAPAFVARRFALREKSDWEAAGERARQLATSELPRLVAAGWTPEPGTCFEIGDDGAPASCMLRLRPAPLEVPREWVFQPEGTALYMVVADVSGGVPGAVRALRAAVPKGARAGTPYLRFATTVAAGGQVQVILPLLPAG
jgi:hypothetical protein